MMEKVFSQGLVSEIENSAKTNGAAGVRDIVGSYAGPLGIDTYRFYAILDAKTGNVLYSSDPTKSANLEKTDNIISAMAGKNGDLSDNNKSYMDYAVPINVDGSTQYIAYVKDMKNEVNSVSKNVLLILIEALLISILIAVVLSFFFSRTITKPIRKLTNVAEKIASGEFDAATPSDAKDEIGILSNTFAYMSSALSTTMEEVNSEKNKVETILNNMTDGILAFNTKGELIHINPRAKKMVGRRYYDDLKFDTFCSSGPGGQGVNTTYSAVRITHKPTGIVVNCQNERSQIQNREQAMMVLKSKLMELEIRKQEEALANLKGGASSIAFGSQIRSYVFCPYTLVKDHRTNVENGNVNAVMDGDLDSFIYGYLKWMCQE